MKPLFQFPLLALGLACSACMAQEAPQTLDEELRAGFFSRINVVGFGLRQDPVDTIVNWVNVFGIPREQAELDLRPDFNLKWRKLELDFKPRFQWTRRRTLYADWLQFDAHGQQAYVNEASVRYRLNDRLILSYGRENLQWGPSALLSPSNPFNASNGRNNPNLELPGLEYARAVYVASPALTVSLIANTGRGRLDPVNRYRKAAAAKIDYTGDRYFFSLIGSHAQGEGNRIGGFAGWNLSEAFSLHAEGSAGRRPEGLFSQRRDRQVLVGAAYTLEEGPTLSAEYFVRDDGCTGLPILACLLLRGALVDPVRPLARRRYAMLQYVDTKVAGNLNFVTRLVRNIDDDSSQLVFNLELELGQHWMIYAIPTFYHGKRGSEFGSLLRKSLFVGAGYTF
jgi:hypothetical protein